MVWLNYLFFIWIYFWKFGLLVYVMLKQHLLSENHLVHSVKEKKWALGKLYNWCSRKIKSLLWKPEFYCLI